jgi:hypothetical protein
MSLWGLVCENCLWGLIICLRGLVESTGLLVALCNCDIFMFLKNIETYPRIVFFLKCRISVSVSARYRYMYPYPCWIDCNFNKKQISTKTKKSKLYCLPSKLFLHDSSNCTEDPGIEPHTSIHPVPLEMNLERSFQNCNRSIFDEGINSTL